MARYEFKIVSLSRNHLREEGSPELERLNEEGKQGFRVVVVRDDPRDGSHLVFFLEREIE
jgi:hypothetical protein